MQYFTYGKSLSLIVAIVTIIGISLLTSCKNDPKIDPKKNDDDKGGSYSYMVVPHQVVATHVV